MTDTSNGVRRRTVLKRAAAGFGGTLAVGAAATDEAAAALCFGATTDSPTYDACPPGSLAFTVSAGEQGPATGRSCTADDGTIYVEVDWDGRSATTWIDRANVESVPC